MVKKEVTPYEVQVSLTIGATSEEDALAGFIQMAPTLFHEGALEAVIKKLED